MESQEEEYDDAPYDDIPVAPSSEDLYEASRLQEEALLEEELTVLGLQVQDEKDIAHEEERNRVEGAIEEWTPDQVADFVRGLVNDFGGRTHVYAQTMLVKDIGGDLLLTLEPENLEELGLTLGHGHTLLRRLQERQPSCRAQKRQGGRASPSLHLEMARRAIPKNNHCLFNAIAYLCCDGAEGESIARSLRRNIAESIISDSVTNGPPKYTEAMLGKPPLEYCEWIQGDANWGGENEICMLCEFFNVEIEVIVMGENTTSLDAYGETNDSQRNGRIFLLYSGQHYDALVGHEYEKRGSRVAREIRIFPVGASEISSLALAFGMTEFCKANHGEKDEQAMHMLAMMQAKKGGGNVSSVPEQLFVDADCTQSFMDDETLQEYLQRCQERVKMNLHGTRRTNTLSQEEYDMLQSLKLAEQLTGEELKKVQDKRLMPVFDPDVTAGIGLTFTCAKQNVWKQHVRVSKVLELSPSNFAGVMPGDALLQIDDKIVSGPDDVLRCIGPYGSVVALKFGRLEEGNKWREFWVSLVREIKASTRIDTDQFTITADISGGTAVGNGMSNVSPSGAATSLASSTRDSVFLREATNVVMSGGSLEIRANSIPDIIQRNTSRKPLCSLSSSEEWQKVSVHITRGCFLILDRQIIGTGVGYATLSPDSDADLQELQIIQRAINLQRPLKSGLGRSTHRENESATFFVHLMSGIKCYAFSQRGLFEIEATMHRLEFRASNRQEASRWVKGMNESISRHPKLGFGSASKLQHIDTSAHMHVCSKQQERSALAAAVEASKREEEQRQLKEEEEIAAALAASAGSEYFHASAHMPVCSTQQERSALAAAVEASKREEEQRQLKEEEDIAAALAASAVSGHVYIS